MKLRFSVAAAAAMLCGLLCGCGQEGASAPEPSSSAPGGAESRPQTTSGTTAPERKESMRVVLIGDSNTEYGHITGALAALLEKAYGYGGTGFVTFSAKSAQPKTDRLTLNIGSWESGDVTTEDNWWGTEQIDAPFGLNVTSAEPGAILSANFRDPGFSLYYLMQPGGGKLRLTLDGEEIAVLDTAAGSKYTAKYTYTGGKDGALNRLKIRLESGAATLFGMETLAAGTGGGTVHNWGNAGANSQHFYHGDKAIFETALAAMEPTHVVYLIGTNDGVDNAAFKTALVEQMNRIKEAAPAAKALLASTFDIDYENSKERMAEYLAHAYPEAAAEAGTAYWDMHAFFGPYDPEQMQDGWHCNAAGGEKIAGELLKQLLALSS